MLVKKSLNEQVELIKKAANSTKELKQAASAHSRRTRKRSTDLRNSIKSNLNYSRDNASTLRVSMKIVSDGLALKIGDSQIEIESGTSTAPAPAPDSPVKMPRQKKLKVDDTAKTKTVEIRLPQPLDGKWYSPNEFVRLFKAFESLAAENFNISGVASYLRRVKDEMIANGYVPVQITQLNQTIKDSKEGKIVPPKWGMDGRKAVMSMDKLIAMFDAHSKQHINKAWTDTNTRDALWDEKREKAEAEEKGLDPEDANSRTKLLLIRTIQLSCATCKCAIAKLHICLSTDKLLRLHHVLCCLTSQVLLHHSSTSM